MSSPKPEDKESPEAKKKAAQALGPCVSMTFENTAAYGMPESLFTSMKDIFEAVLAHQSRNVSDFHASRRARVLESSIE